ncbi:MAG: TetR/AcrR family transcriptional regulator [Lachnospiraceae bacterium]|nr:TetR/AcrR family transcriptional regulator [Lachnospiraceae bacterium]
MRTVKEPDVRRQEILDGAIKVFAKKGYEKTSISDIAKALNISQGLCYRYFSSKEEIYDAALKKYASMIAHENLHITNFDQPIRDTIDAITGSMEIYKDAEKKDPELYNVFHFGSSSKKLHDDLFFMTAKTLVPFIQEMLRKAKERGEISIEDTDGIAIVTIYGWVGLYLAAEMTDEERLKVWRSMLYKLLDL